MMKKAGVILVLALIMLQLASALEIQLAKQTFAPGETLQAYIKGEILEPIRFQDVSFFSGTKEVTFEYNLLRLEEGYYIYAQLPKTERNYTIQIHDSQANFSVAGNSSGIFSVSPGFIIASKDFEIKIENQGDVSVDVVAELGADVKSFKIFPASFRNSFYFYDSIKDSNATEIKIHSAALSYTLPLIIQKAGNTTNPFENIRKAMQFFPPQISSDTVIGKRFLFSSWLNNTGNRNLFNITFNLSQQFADIISVSPRNISELPAGKGIEVNFTLFFEDEGNYSAEMQALSGAVSAGITFNISAKKNLSEVRTIHTIKVGGCEGKGEVCSEDETCSAATELLPNPAGGFPVECCLGECTAKEKPRSYLGWIIFGVVILIAAGIGFYIWRKKTSRTPEQLLKSSQKTFEARLKSPPSQEIRGKLTKV